MSASTADLRTLRRVLLATDLSARGDRALERAVAISAENEAQLTVLHVFEEFDDSHLTYGGRPSPSWRAPPDAPQLAKLQIREGLRAELGEAIDRATLLIEEGEPAEVIERVATSQAIDLIVTGIAREGPFASQPVVVGRTVERLLRRVPTPILVVRNRPRGPYRHVLVTTDFSECSAHALQVALSFFREQTLHVLHAFQAPYSNAVQDLQGHTESFRQTHEIELGEFLRTMVLADDDRGRLVPLVESGLPAQLVRDYVRERGADLVVLGTQGRGAVLQALLGSTAKSILATLPCDALIVRAPSDRPPRER